MGSLPRYVVALATLLTVPVCLRAQRPAARIHGTVQSERNKTLLSGVDVQLVGSEMRAQTGEDGVFDFPELAPGRFVVEARLVGFQPLQATLDLRPGQNVNIGFVLTPLARPIEEVVVEAQPEMTGQMAEFYNRQAEGHGYYITRKDLERLRPVRLSDALHEVPGVRVECKDHRCWLNMGRVQPSLIGTPTCHVQYFIDGVRYGSPEEEVNLDQFSPEDIEGIEIYRGQAGVPSKYTGRDIRCGVVLLWIRIGRRH
jgi:hypothetical protein